jgi:hypothetical protein
MPAAASDVRLDADSFSHRPHLSPSDSDEADKRPPTDSDAEDKDEDVVSDVVAALLVLLTDKDPPSQQSQQDGRQGTWRLRPRAEDIMRHHPRRSMSRPLRTRTSRRGMRIGTHAIHAVLTYPTVIPARHALTICKSRTTTSNSPGRMRNSTSTRDTTALLKTATRQCSHRCDGQGRSAAT